MYHIGRKVMIVDAGFDNTVGYVTEANYVYRNGKRKAQYLVTYGKGQDYLCGSESLRPVDYCCDICGKPRRGIPHKVINAPDEVFQLCFLCSGPPAERKARQYV